jgi:hypothetical protein
MPEHHAQLPWYADDGGGLRNEDGSFVSSAICKTCTFRPWATTARIVSAVVQVRSPDGASTTVPASYDASTGRWVASVQLEPGDVVQVPPGGIRDSYGETNGAALIAG